tara:strand:- start:212 stop:952 length:741 start_codon:yes stop_codon:yes gene_type:complete
MKLVNEGLKAGDLEGIIGNRFSVDQFKSKMGEDKNIMVLAFTADSQAAAKDLERFAETGYKAVLDADATPGTMEDGKYRVFIEFARDKNVSMHIAKFLEDLKKLAKVETFEFTYHKGELPQQATTENLTNSLPNTPEAYEQKVNEIKVEEAKNFFDKFQMMEVKLDDNLMTIKKHNADTLKFELHGFDKTQTIMNEVKAFRLDADAMAECMWMTKYFGPFQITKTTEDRFIFSKDGNSALLSKSGW